MARSNKYDPASYSNQGFYGPSSISNGAYGYASLAAAGGGYGNLVGGGYGGGGTYTDPTIYYGTSASNIVHANTLDPTITQILTLGGNDTIYLYSSAPLSQFSNIDGGTGTDILSFINYSAGLTNFNPFSSSIKGIEQFVGTNYNDSITLTSGLITTFDGAGGNDTLSFSSFGSSINFTFGVTTTYGTFSNFESVTGTNYGDTIIGTSGDNIIDGGAGDDFITGNGGNDTIYGGANNNTIYTGSGNDTIYGGSLGDNIFLGGGNDTIDGGAGGGTNQLHFVSELGLDGITKNGINVSISAANGVSGTATYATGSIVTFRNFVNPVIFGTDVADVFTDDAGVTTQFYGNEGNDIFYALGGNDYFYAGTDRDTASFIKLGTGVTLNLSGSSSGTSGNYSYSGNIAYGSSTLYASGIETLEATNFNDTIQLNRTGLIGTIYGGAGYDAVTFAGATSGITFNEGAYYFGIEALIGSGFNDVINVNDVNTDVNGGAGTDTVTFANASSGVTITGSRYTSVENIIASGYNDRIVLTGVPSFTLDGGAGNDNLDFSGASAGLDVNAASYNNFESLTGSAFNDTIRLGVSQTGFIVDAGTGTNDVVTFASAASGVTINLDNYTNVESLIASGNNDIVQATALPSFAIDGGAGNDTLSFAGASAGLDINAALYNNFENLTGSGFNDTIRLNASQTGLIVNAGAGTNDVVTFASAASGVTINLNNYTNVESLIASGNNDIVQATTLPSFAIDGGAGNDTLSFAGASAGLDINATIYSNFENLTGSGFNDTIRLNGSLTGLIVNAGAGTNDIVTFASAASGVTINLNNYTNVESLIASGNNDIVQATTLPGFALDGGAGNDTLSFAGASAGLDINATIYSNFENLTGSGFNDIIRLGNSQASLVVDGGAGTNDVVTFASAATGVTINLNNYTNVESLIASGNNDIVQATTLPSFVLDGGAGNDTLSFAGAVTALDINAALYSNFENLIASSNNDTIRLGTSQTGLTVDGGAGTNDIVTFAGAVSGVTINGGNYSNVETLVVSGFSDVINLSSTGNWIVNAGNGTDVLSFASANAGITLDGSKYSGIEQLIGTGYDDILNLFAGQFSNIDGGVGFDIVNFSRSSTAAEIYVDNYVSIESVIGTSSGDRFYVSDIGSISLDAGNGQDVLSFYFSGHGVTVDLGSDQIKGFESFWGSTYTDHFQISRGGVYSINGAGGFDDIDGSRANSSMVLFLSDIYEVTGSGYNDVLYSINGNKIDGGAGDDEIYSARGDNPEGPSYSNDDIKGGNGNDRIFAGGGEDNIDGGADNDLIYGENGDDTIYGGAGDDHIAGGSDTNFLYGGDGNDLIEAGDGIDTIDGGTGFDTYSYAYTGNSSVSVDVDGLFGFLTSIERIEGGNGADTFRLDLVNLGSLILDGGIGADTLDLSAATIGKIIDLNNLISIESVLGSGLNDHFVASSIAQAEGVDGGAGTDILDLSSATTGQTIDLNNLVSIESVIGSGQNDRFVASFNAQIVGVDGGAGMDMLDLSSASAGQVVNLNNFVSIESVLGSSQNDRFVASSIAQVAGVDGGEGIDTLDLSNATTGQTINLKNLVSIETVIGSDQNDRFIASSIVQADGIDGGAGIDILDLSNAATGQTIDLNNLVSIEAVLGSGQNDHFVASSIAQADGIDGGAGTDTLDLSNAATGQTIDLNNLVSIESVIGSGQNDRFVASSNAQIVGVDGGAGTDILDLSSASTGQTVNLNNLVSIESVIGSGQNDRFIASSIAQAEGVDGGVGIDTLDLSNATTGQTIDLNNLVSIEAVLGSGQNDHFVASSIAQADGIDGGAGIDILDLSNAATGQTIDLNNLVSIEAVVASGHNDRFIASSIAQAAGIDGGAGTDTLDLTNAASGQIVNLDNLVSIEAVVASDHNDRFIASSIAQAAGIDGGAGTDTLDLTNAASGQIINLDNLVSIEAVVASDHNDRFIASSIAQAEGVDGGVGIDTLDLSNAATGQAIDISKLIRIENVIGSTKDDDFIFSDNIGFGVDAGDGYDTINYSLSNAPVAVDLTDGKITGIEHVIATSGDDTIYLRPADDGAVITVDAGDGVDDTVSFEHYTNGGVVIDLSGNVINAAFNFIGVENFYGSEQGDIFILPASGVLPADIHIDGKGGIDYLSFEELPLSASRPNPRNPNAPLPPLPVNINVGSVLNQFDGFEGIIGSANSDNFILTEGASAMLDGGGGSLNSINFINFTHALDLTFSDDITVGSAQYHLTNILGIAGSNLADIIRGDGRDNFIIGNGGIDMLYGGGGKDILGGGAGNDILYGEAGDDFLVGNAQHDTLYGDIDAASASGNGDLGNDFLGGGSGNDTLYGGYGEDYIRGNSGRDTLYGGVGSDRVEGGNSDDVLFGGLDNDTLDGGGQNDILFGEDGDDILIDNVGVNQLTGGAGRDTFVLGSAAANNTIMDFEIGPLGDILRVGNLLTRGTNFTTGDDFNAAVQQYFRVSETSGNLELFIDQAHIGAFGPSGSLQVGWNQVAAFNGANINLDNLINNGQIVFA